MIANSQISETTETAELQSQCNGTAPTQDARIALLQKFRIEAVQRPDALAANLAVINADLMTLAHGLERKIEKHLLATERSAELHPRVLRETTIYLAVVRQIDRLTQIDGQLRKSAKE
jgi:hypothetical protein